MDILSSDLLMSFFNAALHSYKHDSLVRPFPPGYIKSDSNEKDFIELKKISEEIPCFSQINWKETSNVSKKALELLKWTVRPKRFKLSLMSNEKFCDIRSCIGENDEVALAKDDYIFEVVYNEQEEEKFSKIRGDNDVLYAYHGSRIENFHSILHTGLHNNLNKVSLYGEGIYLSRDLRVCILYSPISKGWDNSLLGNSLSCIAVCELVDHPDVKCSVKCSPQNSPDPGVAPEGSVRNRQTSPYAADSTSEVETSPESREVKPTITSKKRSFIKGSEGGEIPDTYYVVRNDDLVRVKFLIVHAPKIKKDLIHQLTTGADMRKKNSEPGAVRVFVSRHKFFLVMLFYCLVLGFISILNSKAFSNWWREINKKREDSDVFSP